MQQQSAAQPLRFDPPNRNSTQIQSAAPPALTVGFALANGPQGLARRAEGNTQATSRGKNRDSLPVSRKEAAEEALRSPTQERSAAAAAAALTFTLALALLPLHNINCRGLRADKVGQG